jgi:DeoR family glycerol-3-phosphate regulon repressor
VIIGHRHNLILDKLTRAGVVSVTELAREFGVSRETIRRDLKALASRHRLVQSHGGATTLVASEPALPERETINAEGKQRIGRAAAGLVPDGASVILDSGTTTWAIAGHLAARLNLTVYTNSLPIARLLGRCGDNRVILLGGAFQPHDEATQGWDAIATLSHYRADFAFIGAGGITAEPALTDYSRDAGELRSRMLLAAEYAVVVADHTKFGRLTPVRVDHFEKAACLITDRAPERAIVTALAMLPLALTVAEGS